MSFGFIQKNKQLMIRRKEKLNENVQVNFNKSPEISYWAKKLNMNEMELQKTFKEMGSSISKTIAYCQGNTQQFAMK